MFMACVFGLLFHCSGADHAADLRLEAKPGPSCAALAEEHAPPARENPWFVLVSLSNVYPRLESEKMVRYYNDLMRFMAPGFKNVGTVGGLRDNHILWVPYLGVGRILSRRWSVFFDCGFTKGTVRTKSNDRSLVLWPLHTDFEIQRGAVYALIGADFFPWGRPALRDWSGLRNGLREIRPGLGLRHTWTYATYSAKAKFGLLHLGNAVSIHLEDSWVLPSVTPVIDLEMPLGKSAMLHLDAGYSIFFSQREDFEGPVFTLGWEHFFK